MYAFQNAKPSLIALLLLPGSRTLLHLVLPSLCWWWRTHTFRTISSFTLCETGSSPLASHIWACIYACISAGIHSLMTALGHHGRSLHAAMCLMTRRRSMTSQMRRCMVRQTKVSMRRRLEVRIGRQSIYCWSAHRPVDMMLLHLLLLLEHLLLLLHVQMLKIAKHVLCLALLSHVQVLVLPKVALRRLIDDGIEDLQRRTIRLVLMHLKQWSHA